MVSVSSISVSCGELHWLIPQTIHPTHCFMVDMCIKLWNWMTLSMQPLCWEWICCVVIRCIKHMAYLDLMIESYLLQMHTEKEEGRWGQNFPLNQCSHFYFTARRKFQTLPETALQRKLSLVIVWQSKNGGKDINISSYNRN